MKKQHFFALPAALAVLALFVSCDEFDDVFGIYREPAFVVVANEYHRTLESVTWNGINFGSIEYYWCREWYVDPGNGKLSFSLKGANRIVMAETVDNLRLRSNDEVLVIISAGTMVKDLSTGKRMTLSQLAGDAYLTVKNESGMLLQGVMWNNTSFDNSIANAGYVEKMVNAGSGRVAFYIYTGNTRIEARTVNVVSVEAGQVEYFTFTANTLVEKLSSIGNTTILAQLR